MRLITPKRLKENEAFLWSFADQTIDEFIDRGECELLHDYAIPYTLMVIADLLGVPDDDRDAFREHLAHEGARRRAHGAQAARVPLRAVHPLHRGPPARPARRRDDGDGPGHLPRRHAAAGRRRHAHRGQPVLRRERDDGTPHREFVPHPRRSSRVPGSACATDPALIAPFIEEMLRPSRRSRVRSSSRRCARRSGVSSSPPGTTVFVMNDAASRDPRQFDAPERVPARPPQRSSAPRRSVTASTAAPVRRWRGPRPTRRSCGSSPARPTSASPRSTTARPTTRRYDYDPTHLMRGVSELHLEFDSRLPKDSHDDEHDLLLRRPPRPLARCRPSCGSRACRARWPSAGRASSSDDGKRGRGCAKTGCSAAAACRGTSELVKKLSAIGRAGIDDDGYRAGTPKLRLEDMDRDGLAASVIYGPLVARASDRRPRAAERVLRGVERLGGRGVQRGRARSAVRARVPARPLARGRRGRARALRGARSPRRDHRRVRDRPRRPGVGPPVGRRRAHRPADQLPHQGRHVVER